MAPGDQFIIVSNNIPMRMGGMFIEFLMLLEAGRRISLQVICLEISVVVRSRDGLSPGSLAVWDDDLDIYAQRFKLANVVEVNDTD